MVPMSPLDEKLTSSINNHGREFLDSARDEQTSNVTDPPKYQNDPTWEFLDAHSGTRSPTLNRPYHTNIAQPSTSFPDEVPWTGNMPHLEQVLVSLARTANLA